VLCLCGFLLYMTTCCVVLARRPLFRVYDGIAILA
jgi:hypothetical protein